MYFVRKIVLPVVCVPERAFFFFYRKGVVLIHINLILNLTILSSDLFKVQPCTVHVDLSDLFLMKTLVLCVRLS